MQVALCERNEVTALHLFADRKSHKGISEAKQAFTK